MSELSHPLWIVNNFDFKILTYFSTFEIFNSIMQTEQQLLINILLAYIRSWTI